MTTAPKLLLPEIPNLHQLETYLQHGGYEALRAALRMSPDEIIEEVKRSGLRGRGGACFPTGLKWSFMPKGTDKPKYLVVNADESEPGSFKDRQILEHNPHQLIEGTLIAGYAMGATKAFIYIRGEYHRWYHLLQQALQDSYARGFVGTRMQQTFRTHYSLDIVLHKGAGAYICGEETALMESIEGKRGYPRFKPPFPAQRGLWGMPTTINNVETIAAVPPIIQMGGAAYAKIGAPGHPGTILYGLSGHINRPGIYELPTGTLLTDLLFDVGGGVPGNRQLKAVIPGGSSMPPLRGDEIEGVRMDEESLKQLGTHIGTAGIIAMDEDTDIVRVTWRIARFYHHESCGQCTPCREGCGWLEKLLARFIARDASTHEIDLLVEICNQMEGNTICALADAAAWAVRGFVTKFRDEFEARCKPSRDFVPLNVVHGLRHSNFPLGREVPTAP
ncbi:MAG: NADH-quinone oxidoreductase subunit NuoF [Bacteroidota bacterium]|nr:NADH-quinone oxidoreductase subunit NuoF [Bacteroidota bacterium]